jgi:uncharacterized protein (TIGR00645 family)
MVEPSAPARLRARAKHRVERALELWLFRSRWLMAPFYVGLVLALGVLLYVFCTDIWHEITHLSEMTEAHAVSLVLSLIDLSLAGNLVVIVIFSGYETFVSRMEVGDEQERPDWMGRVDFSGMKMKLMASIVAISAVGLLRAFMRMAEDEMVPNVELGWLVGIHLTFVISALLLSVMDFVVSKTAKH